MSDARLSFVVGLTDHEQSDALDVLTSTTIHIVIGEDASASCAGQVLTIQLAALCMRLFDRVVIDGNAEQATHPDVLLIQGPFVAALREYLKKIRPIDTCDERREITVAVGNVSRSADIYLGSTGWCATVSLDTAQSVHDTLNTIGALAAGTLGASEVFKSVFQGKLRGSVKRSYTLSMLDYSSVPANKGEPELENDLYFDATLFGCGSIGFGFLQALILGPKSSGKLTLVDNGKFDLKNPFKYSLLDFETAAQALYKSHWARDQMRQYVRQIDTEAFVGTAQGFVTSLPPSYKLPIALSAVDTVEGRVEIQDTLPRIVINAGITGTTAEVSYHVFGEGPCLACIGLDTALESWDPYPIAEATGLAPARVLALIEGNLRMTPQDIDCMRHSSRLNADTLESLDEYLEQPILSLWNRVVYSEVSLQVGDGQEVRVTTAFVSAFAGLLLYAELVKQASPTTCNFQVNNSYRQELIGVPAEDRFKYPRDDRGWCLCHSSFRQMIYRNKYGRLTG